MTLRFGILLFGFSFFLSFMADANARQDDGPYVTVDGTQLDVKWMCDGKLLQKKLAYVNGTQVASQCAYAQPIKIREAAVNFPAPHRFQSNKIAALSDIHGQFASMKTLLQKHGVIDEQLRWSFGSGHLLIAGDVLDRGEQATEALWLLYSLEEQALQQGGAVHILLGNHEVMVMANDLRYIHPKYQKVAQEFGQEYAQLYGKGTVLGQWLRAKPVIVQINDSLFMHGGLHPDILKLNMAIPEINEAFRTSLGLPKSAFKEQKFLEFLHGSAGPIWYRGYFSKPALASNELDLVLQAFQAKRIVVGHTTSRAIHSRYEGRVVAIDANMKGGSDGEILLFENDVWTRGDMAGKRSEIIEAKVKEETSL